MLAAFQCRRHRGRGPADALGDHDLAIAWLRKAYEAHSADMVFLRTPTWDSLRSDPRFIALMKDVGLPID